MSSTKQCRTGLFFAVGYKCFGGEQLTAFSRPECVLYVSSNE